jgi:hypothetical protein
MSQELNQRIATEILNWDHVESIVYQDKSGNFCYLADYCNSLPHACDLAMSQGIGMVPMDDGLWQAYQLKDNKIRVKDSNLATAIIRAILGEVDS